MWPPAGMGAPGHRVPRTTSATARGHYPDFFLFLGAANGRPWAAYNESPLAGRVKGGFILANYTEHYGLHQWVPEDDFLRTDFNTDFALIDAALAGLAAADGAESQTRSQEDGALAAAITAGDNAQATALASAKTALQNAITSGDNAQASALAAAKTALQNAINSGDNALDAAKAEIVVGTYMGNGQPEQVINLGFTPLAVLFEDECGQRTDNAYYRYTGLLVPNHTFDMGQITTGGFAVYYNYGGVTIMANANNAAYYYLALRPTA